MRVAGVARDDFESERGPRGPFQLPVMRLATDVKMSLHVHRHVCSTCEFAQIGLTRTTSPGLLSTVASKCNRQSGHMIWQLGILSVLAAIVQVGHCVEARQQPLEASVPTSQVDMHHLGELFKISTLLRLLMTACTFTFHNITRELNAPENDAKDFCDDSSIAEALDLNANAELLTTWLRWVVEAQMAFCIMRNHVELIFSALDLQPAKH